MKSEIAKFNWLIRGICSAAFVLASGFAFGQQIYPTYQGTAQRQGQNLATATDNPGQAALTWFFPLLSPTATETLVRDNTSTAAGALVGAWTSPAPGDEAGGFYTATLSGNAATDSLTGASAPNPPYVYSSVIPSDLSGDPRVPLVGTASVFQWTIQPPSAAVQDYALYAWLPIGPTIDSTLGTVYPQRYFVYEIDYGTNQSFVDVVDRDFTGGGFVRLGNGGLPTNALFHYDGIHPITIKLFNTIPRDVNGNLEGVATNSNGTLAKPFFAYADAVQAVPNIGEFDAQPLIVTNPNDAANPLRVFAAFNSNISTQQTGQSGTLPTVQEQGTIDSLIYTPAAGVTTGTVTKDWSFSPILSSGNFVTLDNPGSGVVASPGWTTVPTPPTGSFNQGPDYFDVPITNNAATTQQVTYSPTLSAGTFGVYLWLPGVQTPAFAKNVQVEVDQGAVATFFTVDLTQENGYVQVGNQLFTNTAANPLVVKITNLDTNPADAGLLAYADAVKFVGAYSLAIKSTPVYAGNIPINVNTGTGPNLVNKDVVVVAGEDGRLYCVDADGNGNGTTNVYWAYPTIPSATPDPNINGANAPDGTNNETIAQMPTGFNTSSALIEQMPSGAYNLYIASSNGRVYCINMEGRGDGNTTTNLPGTTNRVWSYPNDYPSTVQQPLQGGFTGSLVYHNNANGPTIFVPSNEGRMFALDAQGTLGTDVTTVKWAFPAVTSPTIGAIAMTPSIDGPTGQTPSIYFGTEMNNGTDPGAFYSLNVETGAVNWEDQQNGFASFDGGLATAFNNVTGDGLNYIYAGNRNGYIYAFSDTGAVLWASNELNTTTSEPLTFTQITTYNNAGGFSPTPVPVVMVPTDDGNFYGLFAAQATLNISGGRLAYGYGAQGSAILAPMAAAQNYLVGTDNAGYLYAFSNTANGLGNGVLYPGTQVGVPNNPATQQFSKASCAFFTQAAYQALTQDPNPSYVSYIDNLANFLSGNPVGFDFGDTMYLILYNFPYTASGTTVPPNINFQISVNGNTVRTISVQSQQFKVAAPANEDGYALLSFPIQAAGTNALTPGGGDVTFQITTTNTNGTTERYYINPSVARVAFGLANPIGIAMALQSGSSYGYANDSLGADAGSFAFPSSAQNLFNGAPSYAVPTVGFIPSAMATSTGIVSDNQTGSVMTYVYDRSLLAILNGPDIGGLTNVRVDRGTLGWQGGYASVFDPIGGPNGINFGNPASLSTYEDYPVNSPNTSLDYPNVPADEIAVTKDPNGKTENPTFNGVTLNIPYGLFTTNANGTYTNTSVPPAQYSARTPNPTPFELDVNVPQFQPANESPITNTLGTNLYGGYLSRINVFADSNNNGILDLNSGHSEAYRSFLLGVGVDPRESIKTVTPNVDLGSIAEGSGQLASTLQPNTFNSVFNPWTAGQQAIYQSFEVLNSGNVNLRNLRLAKQTYDPNFNVYSDWPFYSSGNNSLSYVDGTFSLYSDLDPAFSPSFLGGVLPKGEVFTPKPRVTDASGIQVLTNPLSRLTGQPLVPNFPSQNPRLTITPPIGTPVGQYSQSVDVIQDTNYDNALNLSTEAYSDPKINVSFTVKETRLTNSSSANTQVMADNLLPIGWRANPVPLDSNIDPAATRDLYGDLITSWSSNRPLAANGTLSTTTSNAYRLYFSTIPGTAPSAAMLTNSMVNLGLTDLANFGLATPQAQWAQLSGPYPAGPTSTNVALINALFGVAGSSQHVVGTLGGEPDSVAFGNPSFPSDGQVNPFDETKSFGTELFGFTGSAQVTGATGSFPVHRLYIGSAAISQGHQVTYGGAVAMPSDGNALYSKPSVVQVGGTQAVVLYGSSGAGRSHLFFNTFDTGAFGTPTEIPLGIGFDSATDPSGIERLYTGVDQPTTAKSGKVLEFAFSGKLRGHSNSEIFMGRMPVDVNGVPDSSDSTGTLLDYFAPETENLTVASPGLYRSRGVMWNPSGPLNLVISGTSTTIINVLASGQQDPTTGIWNVKTVLGTAYLDPNVGTVRFVGSIPASNVVISLNYAPQILRVSSVSTSGFTRPTLMWEYKLASSSNYLANGTFNDRGWFEANGQPGSLSDGTLRDDRWVVTYDRSSGGNGQSSHPMVETLRIGIPNIGLTAGSSIGPYQVDPHQTQTYFTASDEGNIFTINGFSYQASLIVERSEYPVPIDDPANDGQVAAFVDPFDPTAFNLRRPTLVWLFWTSSRHGTSDVYFETIAPSWYPVH